MRKFWSVLFVMACWFTFGVSPALAQTCPSVGSNAQVRFANLHVNCANDSLYVDVQLANPTTTAFSASSLSLRFTYNTAMLSVPRISSTTMAGNHTLQAQSGIWSYGLIEFSAANVIPAGGAWTTVGRLSFHVNSYNAGSNSRCLDLTWQTTSPAITTGQQWISFLCQPNLVYTSYGNVTTCISDSCSHTLLPLGVNATATNVTCTGTNNGTVIATVSGGTTPYTYAWAGGATTQTRTGLAPGTYSVTVRDAVGATATASATVGAAGLTIGGSSTNSTCNSSNDGSISLNVLGGNGSYTYNWSDGEHTQNRSFLSPGTYSVTVIDGAGCSGTRSFTLTEPTAFTYRIFIQNVSCAGGSDAFMKVPASPGGIGPYHYIWHKIVLDANFNTVSDTIIRVINTPDGLDQISNLSAGLYELEFTDANGCPGAVYYLISEPNPVVITGLNGTPTPARCYGTATGAINISASGGTGVIRFRWSDGDSVQNRANLLAGTYTVTATDLNGCTASKTFVVTQPDSIKITLDANNGITPVSCNGGANGAVNVTASGGTGTLHYAWSNGAATRNLTALAAGTYTLTVTDSLGCVKTNFSVTITQPAAIVLTATTDSVTCNGLSNGAINLTVAGGNGGNTYLWTPGNFTTEDLTGRAAGTYHVVVTDSKGCTANRDVTIGQPAAVAIATTSVTPVYCNGSATGAIDITPSGGSLPYTYAWSNAAATQDLTNVAAGTYTVTVTDRKGCTATSSITVTASPALTVSLGGSTNVSCNGGSNGSLTITPAGGNPTYTYRWSNNATTQNLTGLTAGSYTVTVTDSKGCTTTGTYSITQPAILAASISTHTNVNCFGGNTGALTASVTGGTTAYTYLWSNGATTAGITGLTAGIYTLTVTDAKGCTATVRDTITQKPQVVITLVNSSGSCIQRSTGALTVSVAGGTSPFAYHWANGGTTATISNLPAGSYALTVTDANLCSATGTYTVRDTVCTHGPKANPDTAYTVHDVPVTIPVLTNDFDSSGNILTVTGILTPPTHGTVTITNGGTTTTYTPAPGFVGVDSFKYVTCDNGVPSLCDSAWVTVFVRGGGPLARPDTAYTTVGTPVTVPVLNNDFDSSGYAITVTSIPVPPVHGTVTTNGTTTTYTPAPGFIGVDSFKYTICDAGNPVLCASAEVYIFVRGGGPVANPDTAYTTRNTPVTVPVLNNDSDSSGYPITVTSIPVPPVHGTVTTNGTTTTYTPAPGFVGVDSFKYTICDAGNPVLCASAEVYVFVRGGGPVANPDTAYTVHDVPVTIPVLNNDSDSGGFAITVTSIPVPPVHGTVTTNGTTTTYTPAPGFIGVDSFKYTICDAGVPSLCASAEVYVFVRGGGPVANPDTAYTVHGVPVTIPVLTNDFDSSGYPISVTGIVTPPTQGTVTINPNGTTTYTPTPNYVGVDSFQYVICDGGTPSLCDSAWVTIFVRGGGPVAVNDTAHTIHDVPVTIPVLTNDYDSSGFPIAVTGIVTPPTQGTVTINPNGTTTYTPNPNFTGVDSFTYVICDNGTPSLCDSAVVTIIVRGGGPLAVNDTVSTAPNTPVTIPVLNNDSDSSGFTIAVTGIVTPPANGTAVINPSGTVTYTPNTNYVGVDSFQYVICDGGIPSLCDSAWVFINVNCNLTAGITVNSNANCFGSVDGSLTVTTTGGTGTLTYAWSNSATTLPTQTGLGAGTYSVTVSDVASCSVIATATITQPDAIVATGTVTNVTCAGGNNGTLATRITGGTAPYTYAWSNGATTANLTTLTEGIYTVTITDAHGCTATLTKGVNTDNKLVVNTAATDATCGNRDGVATVSVTGGTGITYAWTGGGTTASINNLTAGTYSVTVTSSTGCTATSTVAVSNANSAITVATVVGNDTCGSATRGTINLTASNGVAPYTYAWSNGATTASLTGLAAGTYSVTVNDANGCAVVKVITVNPASSLALNATSVNTACNLSTGTATVTVAGGTGTYTYHWSSGATTATASNLSAGVYFVTVIDANGCSNTASVAVNSNNGPAVTINTITNISCATAAGAVDLTVAGGTAPYTYSWSNGATTQNLGGLSAGPYTLTVTDAAGCKGVTNVTIGTSTPIVVVAVKTDAACNSTAGGSVNVTVTGGFAPYTYAWSNGATSNNVSGLANGTFTVTVTDANGCSVATPVNIIAPAPITASGSITNVSCAGGNNGAIALTVTGGIAPYTYAWSNSATTANLTGITAGVYTVVITDSRGCSTTLTLSVNTLSTMVLNTAATDALCGKTDGTATVSVSGGATPYTYVWSNTSTTATIGNVAAGVYNVTVTDGNGCTASTPVAISNANSSITVTSTVTDDVCGSATRGAITLTATGGIAPYTYAWSNNATTASVNGLAAGTYNVTVGDGSSCSTILTIHVNAASSLTLAITPSSATCGIADGSATVAVSGGTGNYTYHWSNGATTANASGLAAGAYLVTVTDVTNGCTATKATLINNNGGPAIAITSLTNLTCATASGAIDITASAGVAPYTYNWSNGSTTEDQTSLGAGLYTVTVTDANGCKSVTAANISVSPAIVAVADLTNPACSSTAGGSINVTVTGGRSPYTYAWSNGATTSNISGLVSGTYTVTVTDASGCSASTPVNIAAPQPIAISSNITNVLCAEGNTGAISLTVTGGTPAFTYAWGNGATTSSITGLHAGLYEVTVTDAGGCSTSSTISVLTINNLVLNTGTSDATCGTNNGVATVSVSGGSGSYTYNWSNGQHANIDSSLAAGNYTVTVTDAVNGCTATATVSVGNITTLAITGSVTNTRCGVNSGSIALTATGGVGSYTYSWSTTGTTANINNLAPGTYFVTVTDSVGCSKTAQFAVESAGLPVLTPTVTAAACGASNGAITLSGGAGASYVWSTGATTQDLNNIPASVYSVTATIGGCSATALVNVSNTNGPVVTVANVTNLACANGQSGAINLTATGTGALTYAWSDNATTQNRTGLYAGTYAVTVTDAAGCSATASATIAAAKPIVIVANQQNVGCNGTSTGSVIATATGGVAPYTYAWTGGSTASSLTGLAAGSYGLTITDANGCSAFTPITITQPQAITVKLDSSRDASCNGSATGMIHVTVTGGKAPYHYVWTPAQPDTNALNSLTAGTYSLVVTDANSCSTTSYSYTINQPATLGLSVSAIDSIKCNGGTGTITVATTGGSGTYTYTWSDGSHGATHTGVAGTYDVTVTDAGGCTSSLTGIQLIQPALLQANVGGTTGLCAGYTDGVVAVKPVGGTAPYTYGWSTGTSTTDSISGLGAGSYTVTITDAHGCSATATQVLRAIDSVKVNATATIVTQPICGDSLSGAIQLHATGGSGTYSYAWTGGSTDSIRNGLAPGSYTVAITDANGCGTSFTFALNRPGCNPPPIAVDDTTHTGSGRPVIVPVLNNDSDPSGHTIFPTGITHDPNHGTATINSNGTITYTPDSNFVGVDTFTYVICNNDTPSQCDSANVYVVVMPNRPNVQIPNGFSPNGDGINDYFEIPDIDKYPGSQLIVFNRWGSTIWKSDKSGYVNNWNGTSQADEPLPDGTYFYIITVNDGFDTKYEGFVTIHR